MKAGIINFLQNDVVAGGFYFKAMFKWLQIAGFILLVFLLIYFIRRKRK
ncbi:LPXTG cell wall anchor domain-containing protein [Mucilaginibacter pineti]|nr:LPXTG cell wall anchor domain-containing protein [Mucilaginibacter pineti]